MICVSRAPLDKLLAYRARMGWNFTWASSHDSDFNADFGVSAGIDMALHLARRMHGASARGIQLVIEPGGGQ
jgi:predicted dithiol-disulfide oxidoreductase (DUF899 family)